MTRSPRAPMTPTRPAQRLGPWLAATVVAAWRRLRQQRAEPHLDLLTPEDYEAAEPGRGRAAGAPWLIPPRGWKDIVWRTWREVGRARLAALAGGVSFYLLLATFPAIAASVSLFGLFSNVDTVEQQFLHFSTIFPSEAIDFLGDQMVRLAAQEHGALSLAFVVSAALSIWSAKAGMQALFDGVNLAYNETEKRPFLKRALLTYAATLVAIAFIVSTTGAALAVPEVLHAIGLHGIVIWWAPVRWLAILAAAVVAFTLVYRFGPSRRPARWRWVAAGGVFAALAWMAGSFGFSWYLNSFTHLGVTYGSLGAMIGFMLWMWLSVLIVLIGAELNAEIEHQTACDTTIGPERPLGERGAVVADTVGGAFPMSPREMRESVGAWILREIRGVRHEIYRFLRLGR
ncbi:MAG TPA: YihY/virulence factor BrkB family protein [Caulobacteraceae bacterium]|jgi:membrane protein